MAKFTELHESGDRWILDTLIPNRDRLLVGPQIERTSRLRSATKPVLVRTGKLARSLSVYTPMHTGIETTLDEQKRLRRRYCSEEPLPGDRIE